MNVMDLLEKEGGGASVAKLASQLGLDDAQTKKLIASLSPALVDGMQKQAQSPESRENLARTIESGHHERYLEDPDRLTDETAREEGNGILGQLFGSKDVSRNIADQASRDTGIDTGLIKKALPLVAGLAMGALGKQAHTGEASQGGLGALAGLLGGDTGGGFGLDDVKKMAGKFFRDSSRPGSRQ